MSDLPALIARLVQAGKPSRAIDVAICESIADYSRSEYHHWCGLQPRGSSKVTVQDFLRDRLSARYTSSLDDAVKVVPSGCEWMVSSCGHSSGKPFASVYARKPIAKDAPHLPEKICNADGPTTAIALCVAALTVRQKEAEVKRGTHD